MGHHGLITILTTAHVDKVVGGWVDRLARSNPPYFEPEPAPFEPPLEYRDVAAVGVDVQLIGVEMAEPHVSTHAGAP